MSQLSLLPVVTASKNGVAVASSVDVATYFDKQHRHVLRDIRQLLKEDLDGFTESNFGLSNYRDPTGRLLPMYLMTKDGFTLLAMGFTGEKAIRFKVAYIRAFNMMAKRLAASHALSRYAAMGEAELAARVDALVKANGPRAALAAQARQLHAEGLTYAQIASVLHLSSRHVVYRLLKRFGPALSPTSLYGTMVEMQDTEVQA